MINFLSSISTKINIEVDVSSNNISEEKKTNIENIHTNFKLPITYLNKSDTFELSDVVANDLELVSTNPSNTEKSIYDHLFQPTHAFARSVIPEWKKKYTNNAIFLEDSQQIIVQMGNYKNAMSTNAYSLDCDKFMDIWRDIKCNDYFTEKYNYMDWSMLKHLNESSHFLQCLSVIHILSPVISFILPFIFLIFPFIILKLQQVPITFSKYMEVLKNIAQHHFIGKALTNMKSLSWDKIAYMGITFGLYLLQIYQNIQLCTRFYTNIQKMNHSLCELKQYTKYSMESMEKFLAIAKMHTTYGGFCTDIEVQLQRLSALHEELKQVQPFNHSIHKFGEVGYMLKCYYSLHSNPDYESCIRYSTGFEGYMNNLAGVYDNIVRGNIHFATFVESNVCEFKQQSYPVLENSLSVKNNCNFEKNMIISAPNKSGKTTVLKTTVINIIFSQQVGGGFYGSATLTPYTHIHSYLNIPDTSGRDSLFQAESRRCKEIIDIIAKFNDSKYRHFCIFDELYSGTNPKEAATAGHAFLKYLNNFSNVNYMLTTHYVNICKKFKKSTYVRNYKMDVNILPDGRFDYTYRLKKGISTIKGAVRVLKDMDYPDEIIQTIETQPM
jgi:hypothetical protein